MSIACPSTCVANIFVSKQDTTNHLVNPRELNWWRERLLFGGVNQTFKSGRNQPLQRAKIRDENMSKWFLAVCDNEGDEVMLVNAPISICLEDSFPCPMDQGYTNWRRLLPLLWFDEEIHIVRTYRVTLCIAEGNQRAYVEEIFEYRMPIGSKNDSCYRLVGSLMECCFLVIQDDG